MAHAERLCDRLSIVGGGRGLFEGSVSEARRLLPVRIDLETSDPSADPGPLPGVVRREPLGSGRWNLELGPGADPSVILEACFERALRLRRFEVHETDLHDVFVHLVGPAAREASMR